MSESWGLPPEAYIWGAPGLIAGRLSAEPWLALVGLALGVALSRWLSVLLALVAAGFAWGAASYLIAHDQFGGPLGECMYLAALPIVACALLFHGVRRLVRPASQIEGGSSKGTLPTPVPPALQKVASPPLPAVRLGHLKREFAELRTQRWLAMCLMVTLLCLVLGYVFESLVAGPFSPWEWLTEDASPSAWALVGAAIGGLFSEVSGVLWRTRAIPSFFAALPFGFVAETLSGVYRPDVYSFFDWLLPNEEYTAPIWGILGAVIGGLITWYAIRGRVAERMGRRPKYSSLLVLAAPILVLATLSLPAPPDRASFEIRPPTDYVVAVGNLRFRNMSEEEGICLNERSHPQCQAYQQGITRRYALGLVSWVGAVATFLIAYLMPTLTLLGAFRFGLLIKEESMRSVDAS